MLTNPRHERFAQEVAKGASIAEAYRAAGYRDDRRHASRLLATNGDVVKRIGELRAQLAEKAVITQESLLREVEEALGWARSKQDTKAAVAAIKLKAQLTGFLVQERRNEREPLRDVPDDVLEAEIERLLGELEIKDAKKH
jgi:phage terminase small subunit